MKDKKWKELNLEGKHCWKDVIQAANQAEAVYLEAGRKIPRKVSRFITANAEAAVPFLYLIPNDWYCCILFGGLKLVFEVGFCGQQNLANIIDTRARPCPMSARNEIEY